MRELLTNRAVVASRWLAILASRAIGGRGRWRCCLQIEIGAKLLLLVVSPIVRDGTGIVEYDHDVGPG